MSVHPDYLPRYVPENYVFYSHVSTDSVKAVADSLNIDASDVLILPYNAKQFQESSPYSAFVRKSSSYAVDRVNAELDVFYDCFKMFRYPFTGYLGGGEFTVPLNKKPLFPLFAKFAFDIETSKSDKREDRDMTNGDRVILSWGSEKLRGVYRTRFYDAVAGEDYITVRLDGSFSYRNASTHVLETVNFLTGPARNVRKIEPDGITLNFPQVIWRFNGETRSFNFPEHTAKAFTAMAHVDKIQAIKSFRSQFEAGLKEAKDIIEALMLRYPR
jgi:hypothetical protein